MIGMPEYPVIVVGKVRKGPNMGEKGVGSAGSQNLHATKSNEIDPIFRKREGEVRCSHCYPTI